MSRKKTHEEYVIQVKNVNPNIDVIEKYIDAKTKILHECKIDHNQWSARPNNILNGKGCPLCGVKKILYSRLKSNEKYVDELHKINPNIKALDTYIADNIKILHECKICGHKWFVKPSDLLQGGGCPLCAHEVIGDAPEYKNSIWASEYKKYFSKYLSEEQMKNIMPHSGKNINVVCPDCGAIKSIKPCNLLKYGFYCICSDGQSFPNKFVYNVLTQLKVKTVPEYSPKWANRKVYDDYIPEFNMIIENHGIQHYNSTPYLYKSLEEEQANDLYKMNLAMENGIQNYIVLDCRKSEMSHIRKSIMQSKLPEILNFSESDIDWLTAQEYATSNLIKTAADMFNKGISINKISENLYKSKNTIRRWLKNATELGWCNYISKPQKHAVYCIELNQQFESIRLAVKHTGATSSGIIKCCCGTQSYAGINKETNKKLHWLYLEDAIDLNGIL